MKRDIFQYYPDNIYAVMVLRHNPSDDELLDVLAMHFTNAALAEQYIAAKSSCETLAYIWPRVTLTVRNNLMKNILAQDRLDLFDFLLEHMPLPVIAVQNALTGAKRIMSAHGELLMQHLPSYANCTLVAHTPDPRKFPIATCTSYICELFDLKRFDVLAHLHERFPLDPQIFESTSLYVQTCGNLAAIEWLDERGLIRNLNKFINCLDREYVQWMCTRICPLEYSAIVQDEEELEVLREFNIQFSRAPTRVSPKLYKTLGIDPQTFSAEDWAYIFAHFKDEVVEYVPYKDFDLDVEKLYAASSVNRTPFVRNTRGILTLPNLDKKIKMALESCDAPLYAELVSLRENSS